MSFEPQKFFIGIIDFFSILLPGALLTYLVEGRMGPYLLGDGYAELNGPKGWIAFLFSSYLLGHFVFLVGSWWLDDHVYDSLRDAATPGGQIRRLARGKKPSAPFTLWLARLLMPRVTDLAVSRTGILKNSYLDPLNASAAVNTFQWCKARLTLGHPEALAAVQRFEADSKFFRSLVIVLAFLATWGIVTCFLSMLFVVSCQSSLSLVSLPLLPMALWRYVDQRGKATSHAYWYVLTLEADREGKPRTALVANDIPSHAGGVVFQVGENGPEFLLVHASNSQTEWVLPKGHMEPGEAPAETAVREVREETAVWARVKGPALGTVRYLVNREPVTVRYFLMEALTKGRPIERRGHTWASLDQALLQATHPESKEMLRAAEKRVAAVRKPEIGWT